MKARNLLFIMSDEHARSVTGCYGNGVVRTPHLDALARRGTRFDNAYTPSPVCVSARASLATGRWVHQTGAWSSAEPYHGQLPSWGHRLRSNGHRAVSIGKLHFRSRRDDNGFDPEVLPLHIVGETGFTIGLLRNKPLPSYERGCQEFAGQLGAGDTTYTLYDRRICAQACEWLRAEATKESGPWVLFVSFVSPHFPLIAPSEYFDLYHFDDIGWPHRHRAHPDHPVLQDVYEFYNYNKFLTDEHVKRARIGYYALVSFLDSLVGELLKTLEHCGLEESTRVLYTTDHGELLGDHGMWTKMLMYEGSAGVPLILAGPDVPAGHVVSAPVSLVDCYPTIIESAGLQKTAAEEGMPGVSLFESVRQARPDRAVLSEYHDGGATAGYFMLRYENWKYIYYAGARPQLFDLANDPDEDHDLGVDSGYAHIRRTLDDLLHEMLDPEAVNHQAFADQTKRIEELGGREAILSAKNADFGFTPLDDIETDVFSGNTD